MFLSHYLCAVYSLKGFDKTVSAHCQLFPVWSVSFYHSTLLLLAEPYHHSNKSKSLINLPQHTLGCIPPLTRTRAHTRNASVNNLISMIAVFWVQILGSASRVRQTLPCCLGAESSSLISHLQLPMQSQHWLPPSFTLLANWQCAVWSAA